MYNDELKHYGVLGMRWGIRRSREVKGVKANKKKYKGNKEAYNKDMKVAREKAANRLYSKQNRTANKEIANMSTGQVLVRTALLGSFGSLKYSEAKGRGASTGKAVVEGILYNWGNNMSGTLLSNMQYLDNRAARK